MNPSRSTPFGTATKNGQPSGTALGRRGPGTRRKDAFENRNGRHGARPAGVIGKMGGDLGGLRSGQPVVHLAVDMERQLFGLAHGNERGHRDQASVARRQCRSAP